MRFDKVNIAKSKQKERLIRKTGVINTILDYFIYIIFIGAYPILSGLFFLDQLGKKDYLIGSLLIFSISLLLGGLLCYSVFNLDRMKRIKGISEEKNREAIKNSAEKLGWTIRQHNQKMTVVSPPWSWLSSHWGQQLVILYDGQDILINSTTYGRNDLKSPFHWLGNKRHENIFKQEFEESIKNIT